VSRLIVLVAASTGLLMSTGASSFPSPSAAGVPPTAPIIDLNFGNISGTTVPDASGNANNGAGKMGVVGSETDWNPSTTRDSLGNPAAVFDGTQEQRIEIPDTSGSLNVNHFSILVQFTLDESVDTDPAHQRYELMEDAGSFWFNVREDTTPKYLLRVGGFFNGSPTTTFTGTHPIPDDTLTWAIATYDGADLTTYTANGSGANLALDNSAPQTGTLDTGATITGVDENLVVGAKHRKGAPSEDAEAFFNGTMSRFLVYDTALTPSEIASVISGPVASPKPGTVQATFIQKSIMSSDADPTVPYKVAWTQGTCPAGSTYNLAVTNNGSTTEPYTGTALNATVNLLAGAGYTIAVNCGEGDSSMYKFTSTGYQEGSASYTGTWHSVSFAGAWGGTAKYTTAASASATFQCSSCQALAWVTDEDSAHGSAKVYVDGVLKATINTHSSSKLNRVIAYTFEWASNGDHTLKIVNVATSGHPRISVDGFLAQS
jgi:hypothetical protein